MNWTELTENSQIEEIKQESEELPVMIFKHSTSCSISSMALNRLERSWQQSDDELAKIYYLDLLTHRSVSDAVADSFHVTHQSPQILIIKDGKAVYDTSHLAISYNEVLTEIKS